MLEGKQNQGTHLTTENSHETTDLFTEHAWPSRFLSATEDAAKKQTLGCTGSRA